MPPTAYQVIEMPMTLAVDAIRSGLAPHSMDSVAKTLHITTTQLAQKLGISPRTLNDLRNKRRRLSPENSEKLVRVARVHILARKIFSTDDAVANWLGSPAPSLDGAKPIDLLDTDVGSREVEAVLQGIAYGNVM